MSNTQPTYARATEAVVYDPKEDRVLSGVVVIPRGAGVRSEGGPLPAGLLSGMPHDSDPRHSGEVVYIPAKRKRGRPRKEG